MPNDKPRLYELLRQEHEMMFGGVPCPPGAVATPVRPSGCACGLYPSMRGARETPPGGSVHERRACKSVHGVIIVLPDFGPIEPLVDAAVVAWDAVRPLAPTEMLDALAAGIAPVRRESTPVETAMVYCALPWCGREHEVRVKERRRNVVVYECETLHCSDRCREYDERRGVVVARFATYTDAMARAYRNGTLPPHAQTEWRWAEAKRDDELAPIERQFRSLRVEP